ncbi:MAG TPA: hypothetical protein VFV67_06385 [Actinophytocola sp.]|uniref:hypothetical protein n=1 Tax=Actinophytocola sp. TaxID=1872138 RepID=UPI002DBBF4BB|nr:hypothetical protein [Actinophytocola sp.]HEU5470262.1 hypothetical protein [Actinophytocola sp.]
MLFRALCVILSVFTMLISGILANTATASAAPTGNYCTGFAEPVAPGSRDLVITDVTCSDTLTQVAVPAVKIAEFYEHGGFGGRRFDLLVSVACDGAGYSVNNMDGVNAQIGGMSSYRLMGQCSRSTIYTGLSKTGSSSGTLYGDQSQVSGTFNDRTRSFRAWRG